MSSIAIQRKFSLTCPQCSLTGVPIRVESQTLTTLTMSVRCASCNKEWIADGDLPVFLTWVKRDRRRPAEGGKDIATP